MKSKGAIVYYSWVGNTEVVAKEIQRLTAYDLIKIEEEKERKLGSIMGAGMGAFFGLRSSIKPAALSLEGYDNIFLGAQVWAGKTTPAVNEFLSKANIKGKKVWIFITKADNKVPHKVIDSIKRRVENKGGEVIDCISLTTKWDPKTNIPISVEEISSSIKDWINQIHMSL